MRKLARPTAVLLAAVALTTVSACGGTGGSTTSSDTVTVYSADGLGDWYKTQFDAFTKQSGIKVNYVEAGSGEVVSRVEKEKSNPQADVLVTLPPFIQQADKSGDLEASGVDTSAVDPKLKSADGEYVALADNYFTMIRGTSLNPKPQNWTDLTGSAYKQKIQYSTPGQAGDGTALLVLVQHIMGDDAGLKYLGDLQTNNVGPSSSTGKLGPKVSKGELAVANSDVQMALQSISADKSAYETYIPEWNGTRTTLPLPYYMGLANKAPHQANGKKLMEFLLSKDVQSSLPSGAFGAPVRTDVTPTGPNWDAFQKALTGVTVWYPDWDSISTGLDASVKAYDKVTGQ
ncbi:2-aminoethylphosphonate ABC transporter substrate-binding protein [Tsukamurella soli]|uniref:2-aminoethylphosphonate ABC transporter substrate-binding protein n=1 Tax=Tsukamurella soli TaxID=644556 RepID=A0ABP8JNN0_9ACTN